MLSYAVAVLARFPSRCQSSCFLAGQPVLPTTAWTNWRSREPLRSGRMHPSPATEQIMANPKSPALTVVAVGPRCSIDVPSARAAALSAYLRKHGITSDPPEPSSSGLENIVLHRGADVKKVQALLDAWK